jgi:hypothetical protein
MKEYRFPYGLKPGEMTILSMAGIYTSMPGVVNIIFTLSLVLVTYRFWAESGWIPRMLMILGMALFPLLQPGAIYLRSRRIVSRMPDDMVMGIGKDGVSVESGGQSSTVKFRDFASAKSLAGMMVLQTAGKQSYVLTRRLLGERTAEVFKMVRSRISGA